MFSIGRFRGRIGCRKKDGIMSMVNRAIWLPPVREEVPPIPPPAPQPDRLRCGLVSFCIPRRNKDSDWEMKNVVDEILNT